MNNAGTRAAAVTGVIISKSAVVFTEKTVILDRPFVYLLIDTETNIPLFIGVVSDVG